LSEYVSASDKRYQAIIRLGGRTDTFDAEGKVTPTNQPINVTEQQFEEVLKTFIGEIEQTPPPYSAVKVQGRKAYEMARKGEEVELEPRKITVHHLEVLEWAPPEVVIDVHCSSGTYVRSLANDLGEKLGCGAYLVGLRRTKSGRFSLRDAVPLRKLQEAFHAGNSFTLCASMLAFSMRTRRRNEPTSTGLAATSNCPASGGAAKAVRMGASASARGVAGGSVTVRSSASCQPSAPA